MTEPTISVQLLRHIANCVELTGRPCQPLLSAVGLKRADLDDRDGTIPLRDFLRLFEDAAKYVGNAHFGLQTGRLAASDSLGALSFLFMSAPSLREAFGAFVRYLETMQQAARNSISVANGVATFEYQILDPGLGARRQDAEYSISATCTLARNYCGGQLGLREVCFEHTRTGEYSAYRDFFGCDVFFEQRVNSLAFDATVLDQRGRILSPDLFPILLDHLQRKALSGSYNDDPVERLHQWLEAVDVSQSLRIDDAATAVGISAQSLQRCLRAQDTSWREMLLRRRIELAKSLLVNSRRSIADIAVSTGYAEASNFIRAFRNCTGMSPSVFRREAANPIY